MRRGTGLLAAVLAVALLAAPAASAEPVGDRCEGDDTLSGFTLLTGANGEIFPVLPPVVPPESGDVITGWTVRVSEDAPTSEQKLVVYESTREARDLRKLAETKLETISPGSNEFTTRIEVPEYASIGLYGPDGTLFCDDEDEHSAGAIEGDPAIDAVASREFQSDIGVPVTVTLERTDKEHGPPPESDNEDECTPDGSRSDFCPEIETKLRAVVGRRAILLTARPSSRAPEVEVSGRVAWPTRRLGTRRRRAGPRRRVAELDGDTRTEVRFGRFELPLPRALVRRLVTLPPRAAVPARLRVTVTDVAGVETTKRLVVKVHGRKPVARILRRRRAYRRLRAKRRRRIARHRRAARAHAP